jgi:hypothetical protein
MSSGRMNRAGEKTFRIIVLAAVLAAPGGSALAEEGSDGAEKAKTAEYVIKLAVPGSVAPGETSQLRLTVLPVAPWKINDVSSDGKKFPHAVKIKDAGKVAFEKDKFVRADAQTVTKEKVVFVLPFTVPVEGKHEVTMTVDLAVCKQGNCHSYWGSSAPVVKATINAKTPEQVVSARKEAYSVKVAVPPAVAPGKEALMKVTILPAADGSLNEAFAFGVKVQAPAQVVVAKKDWKKKDAAALGADKVQFSIPFTVKKAGTFSVTLKVRLSVVGKKAPKAVTETVKVSITCKS